MDTFETQLQDGNLMGNNHVFSAQKRLVFVHCYRVDNSGSKETHNRIKTDRDAVTAVTNTGTRSHLGHGTTCMARTLKRTVVLIFFKLCVKLRSGARDVVRVPGLDLPTLTDMQGVITPVLRPETSGKTTPT